MSEMIERVARAFDPKTWVNIDVDMARPKVMASTLKARKFCVERASSAIAAMCPLPEEIAREMASHFDNDIVYGQPSSVDAIWSEIIAAILRRGDHPHV